MNIKDFKDYKIREWSEIFTLQREVNEQFDPEFKEISQNFDISYHEDQEVFKRYCWCITEELCEALEAVELEELTHITEELTDALNFTIQLYDLYGWDFTHIEMPLLDPTITLKEAVLDAIYNLGLTANCLKNRRWRENQYLVDLYQFEPRLKKVFTSIINTFYSIGLTDNDIKGLWDLKYQVNKFRIDSKY